MNLKLLQNEQFKKAAKPTGDLVWNKIFDKIKKASKTLPKNNSETKKRINT